MKNAEATRLYCFLSVLVLCTAAELLFPRRAPSAPRLWRWLANFTLMAAGTFAVRLALPLLALDMALLAESRGWGLLNLVSWPFGLKAAVGFLLLDLVIYFQHWTFHVVPVLWRMHKVHHTDVDLDASSGVRFHAAEIIVSMAIKLAAIALLGAHFLTVLAFEVVLNASSLFNHANLRIPRSWDAVLRLVLVTPDVHRVHHSRLVPETNSNFGFNFPWWDRLFGTYEAQPLEGHQDMELGIAGYEDWREQNPAWLLALPFTRPR